MSSQREINRLASRGPPRPSRAYNLCHVTLIIRKWLPIMGKLSGALDSAYSREDTNILLAQIILCSDCSGSVKELRWLLQPLSSKVVWKKSRKKGDFHCTMGLSAPSLHRVYRLPDKSWSHGCKLTVYIWKHMFQAIMVLCYCGGSYELVLASLVLLRRVLVGLVVCRGSDKTGVSDLSILVKEWWRVLVTL